MPETIELAREATYLMNNSMVFPDGLPMYQRTDSLRIPLKFKLSAMDEEYNVRGPATLLHIAAQLQSLTLPLFAGSVRIQVAGVPAGDPIDPKLEGTVRAQAFSDQAIKNLTGGTLATAVVGSVEEAAKRINDNLGEMVFPAACVLDLMSTQGDLRNWAPGIRCRGFIERVSILMSGPWLSGKADGPRNLPSSAEYSFTFVHAPNYVNAWSKAKAYTPVQALAPDVMGLLYNTYGHLFTGIKGGSLAEDVDQTNLSIQGYDASPNKR